MFVLPILDKLLSGKRTDKPTVLIITPTRKLAKQVRNVVRIFSKGTWIRSICIYGGMSMAKQISELRRPQHVIIGCPGRLLDHLERRTLTLQNINTLVLDEADQLHDMGFLPSIRSLLRQIPAARQTLLFSATMEPEIERLIGDLNWESLVGAPRPAGAGISAAKEGLRRAGERLRRKRGFIKLGVNYDDKQR